MAGTGIESGSQESHPPRQRHSVFISSTSLDLAAHRQQVIDQVLRLGLFPVAMEQFGAHGSGDAGSVSTDRLGEAEVYVGIIAWRYGTIPPGETRSVTHLEYLEAQRRGLPCYLFLADPATEADETLFPAAVRDPEHAAQLLAFRAELQQRCRGLLQHSRRSRPQDRWPLERASYCKRNAKRVPPGRVACRASARRCWIACVPTGYGGMLESSLEGATLLPLGPRGSGPT